MIRLETRVWIIVIVCALFGELRAASPDLQRIELPIYHATSEVNFDIGELIAEGRVQPRSAITIDRQTNKGWLLRTPKSSDEIRWYRNLLNARPDAPDLTIDVGLEGTYDVYAQVRAVNAGGAAQSDATFADLSTMAFQLSLDDESENEIVMAKGFPDFHFDTEILAGHRWNLTGRKIVLRSLGKPVYLHALRFSPAKAKVAGQSRPAKTVKRWLASDHVVIAKDDTKHLAFPGIERLENGELVVVYRESTRHMIQDIGKISLSRSRDRGRTWQPRVTAVDRPGLDDRDPSLLRMPDDRLLLFSMDYSCISKDGGRTWSAPVDTPVFGPHGAVLDEDGHIVYGGLRRVIQTNFTMIGRQQVTLMANSAWRSHDLGRSWIRTGLATYTIYKPGPYDYIWYDEPFMSVIPNRAWIMASRVDMDGFARITRSTDHGKTWGEIKKTKVWGYPQHLLPLRDGRLLMTYGYRRHPFGIRACLSDDHGVTWGLENEIVIRMDGGAPAGTKSRVGDWDLGYPVSIQLPDGRIFTVYYFNKDQSNCYIAGTFWNLPDKQ